jgi:two-component system chemotaxis response regulator CheY
VQLNDVIVVDDSPTMRMLVAFALRKYVGLEIREAGNGVEALEVLARKTTDLMVVDINMPEMNGLELIKAIRADPDNAELPIIVITTEGSDEDIRRGLQAGATEYLVKPFQPQKLHSILDRLMASGTAGA